MPDLDVHLRTSLARTGKDYRAVHEWIDHPDHKYERHDIGRVLEFAREITERFGEEAAREYVRHLQDDVEKRFVGLAREFEAKLADHLRYFGCGQAEAGR